MEAALAKMPYCFAARDSAGAAVAIEGAPEVRIAAAGAVTATPQDRGQEFEDSCEPAGLWQQQSRLSRLQHGITTASDDAAAASDTGAHNASASARIAPVTIRVNARRDTRFSVARAIRVRRAASVALLDGRCL